MAKWKWEGLDKNGKRAKGEIQATDEKDVRKALRGQGVRVKKLIPPSIFDFDMGEWLVEKGILGSFGEGELGVFTKQLSTMLGAGVPILQSMEILYKSEKHPALKKSIRDISIDVGEGKTIAEAMSKQKGFSRLYCNLVKAGEAGGVLDKILVKLSTHMEKQKKIRSQIKSAMMYPTIVMIVGVAVIWGLMTFVVPKFTEMLLESNQKVPWITQMVVDVSKFFQRNTVIMLPGFIAGMILFNHFRKTPTGKPGFDKFMMKAPIFGAIVIKGNLASFCRTLATMLSSGVPLTDSMDICIETVDNTVISNDIKLIKKALVEGKTFTDPLTKIDYFPPMVSQMIKVGEQTGNLDQMLERIADVFEDEVQVLISNMTKMIEPLVIVFLGGTVGVVLIAMYLPIFLSAGGADDEGGGPGPEMGE